MYTFSPHILMPYKLHKLRILCCIITYSHAFCITTTLILYLQEKRSNLMAWVSAPVTVSSILWMYPFKVIEFFLLIFCVCLFICGRKKVWGVSYFPQCFLGFFLDTVNQVDNTGKIEFQEFKVFWEKMKKWIVCVDLYWKTVNELCDENWRITFLCCSDY